MTRVRVVTSPDGDRWRVRRRWLDRGMPKLRERFGRHRKKAEDSGLPDGAPFLDILDGPLGIVIAVVGVALLLLVVVVLLPLIGLALELVLLILLFTSGLLGRVVLRRPWTVEAIDLDDRERSVAYAVKGFAAAGRAAEELARVISTSGPPEQLASGKRTVLPRPTF